MKPTTILAVALAAVAAGLAGTTVAIGVPSSSATAEVVTIVVFFATLVFPLTGALLATRLPRNPIGWLFLLIGLGLHAGFASEEYARRALVHEPELPAGIWVAWVSEWVPMVWLVPLPLVLLLFPDGRLPSSRWRPFPLVIVLCGSLWAAVSALRPGPLGEPLEAFSNPVGIDAIGTRVDPGTLAMVIEGFQVLVGVSFLLSIAAAISRFRGSRGLERQQLKLFAYSAGIMATILLALLLSLPTAGLLGIDATGLDEVLWVMFVASFCGIAIAVTLAILRYRLYDIDLLIKRTVVYGATSATIAVTFFLGLVALQGALRPLTSGSDLAVAASTLASFVLAQPIRRRVQGAVDQRFDRSRYDAARTLDAFADRLRDEVDLDALRSDLLGAVRQTMAPAHVSLWLRDRNDLRTAPR